MEEEQLLESRRVPSCVMALPSTYQCLAGKSQGWMLSARQHLGTCPHNLIMTIHDDDNNEISISAVNGDEGAREGAGP